VQSSLFQCYSCDIVVHRGCYGIAPHTSAANWQCDRCLLAAVSVRCTLCPNLGGAFKAAVLSADEPNPTTPLWAHVVCGLWVPEAIFGNVDTLTPVVLAHVPRDRFRLVRGRRQRTTMLLSPHVLLCLFSPYHVLFTAF
jgi:hypothetical protein